MKRLAVVAFAVALGGALLVAQEGPDDQFIRIYNLIQQADGLRETGQGRAAQDKYLEAQAALEKLQAAYPKWNEKIVNYRRSYLAEKLGALGALTPAPAPAAPSPGKETPPPVPTVDARDQQISALTQEVQLLRNQGELLQAKLREALSAQPAAVDPRELAKAEDRIRDLAKENELLKSTVSQQQEKLAQAADPAALAEAKKALQESTQALARQAKAVTGLNKEKEELEQRLKKLTDKAEAKARKEEAKKPKAPPAEAGERQVAELKESLRRAEAGLAQEKSRAEALSAEKAALEKRVAELAGKRETVPLPAVAPEKEKPAVDTGAAQAAEKAQVKQLERERDDLRKKVTLLTRQLEDRKSAKGAAQADQVAEQLTILRARVQVYESRQVPYSPEELALLKQAGRTTVKAETAAAKRPAKEVPAGAAALMAEARRAFNGRRFEEAEKKFQQAADMDDKNITALNELAAAQIELKRLDLAEANLKRVLAQDPNDGDALSLQGLLRFRQEKYDEAFDTLTRAAQVDPDNAVTQNYLGIILGHKGLRAPAETAFRKAIQLLPGYGEAHRNLAFVYATQTPPYLELARWHYQKALAAGRPAEPELDKLLQGGSPAK
jgi:Flp pilus assembly protein TadD